jgi:hypothetical protein
MAAGNKVWYCHSSKKGRESKMNKLFWGILLFSLALTAQNIGPNPLQQLKPARTDNAPVLDGVLDDKAWQAGPLIDSNWVTYSPMFGNVLPQRTDVYLAYDNDNLYFAFYCYDNEANKIKTSITQRDNLWNDDWVGFSLDAVGNKQSGYDLFINPNGMQGDIYRTANGEDQTTDWVWYSAGKVVDDGYIVEARVPLKNIRFTSGNQVEMGILFWRRISRLGLNGSWPKLPPGEGVFNSAARVIFDKLKSPLKLEALPSFTTGSIWDRESPSRWTAPDRSTQIGLGLKYGITSSISAEMTVNPDFSQVESDAFQVAANQRYPTFYLEKRPFFMELGNIFSIAGYGGASNVTTAVHTRNIVDPQWGLKLSGESGRTAFGFLGSADQWPGRSWGADSENPDLGKSAYFFIGRGKYNLGGENYLGAIYSGHEFAGTSNHVIGTDLSFLFMDHHSLKFNYLYSFSALPDTQSKTRGQAVTALYNYTSRPFNFGLRFEQYGDDFQMDSAFYQRNGFYKFRMYSDYNLFPDAAKLPWFQVAAPYLMASFLHDTTSGMDDKFLETGWNFTFTRQGYFSVSYNIGSESWAGRTFDQKNFYTSSGIQLNKWFNIHVCGGFGDSIYYDEQNPFLGKSWQLHSRVTLQANEKLNFQAELIHSGFNRADSGEKVYDVNIVLSRLTYQFNKHLFVRGLVQYDSYRHVVLSDLLASFTLIPGSVIHLGYGSLNEKQGWLDNQWQKEIIASRYYQTRQSLFFKVSYLFQL